MVKDFRERVLKAREDEGDEIKREELESLKKAIDGLSEKEKGVIEEFYFEGKTMREMSKGRRCHYMAVVKNKERAIRKLREGTI